MNDIMKMIAFLITVALSLTFVLVAAGLWQDESIYYDKLKECRDYQTYGYITEWQGSCSNWYDCEGKCLVYMEDGTRLPLKDFKTMAIKQAMVR